MGRAGGGGHTSHASHSSHSFHSSSRSSSSHSFNRNTSSRPSRPSSPSRPSRPSTPSHTISPNSGVHIARPDSHPRPTAPPPPFPMGSPYVRSTTTYVNHTTYVNNGSPGRTYGGDSNTDVLVMQRRNQRLKIWITILVILTLIFAIIAFSRPSGGTVSVNTTNREKLELGYGYSNDTLTDEIDWIKNPSKLNRNLKDFYDKTGVVPYIALVYRPDITIQGMDAEESYADSWYGEHLPNEGYMLCMYFDTGDPDVDGNCYIVCGEQVGVLIDAEAQDIFWEYMDHYWFSDVDEDTLFAQAFNKTADRIMQRQTTGMDVAKAFFTVMAVGCGVSGIICIMLLKRKHEAERAAETQAILNTPLRDSGSSALSSSEEDDLLARYGSSERDMGGGDD